MKVRNVKGCAFFTGVSGFLMIALLSFIACEKREPEVPAEYNNADIKLGGLLYDTWYKLKKVEVSGNHPLYPPEGKKTGSTTWRCKECHGWDYVGKDGRYKSGTHYTGINGIYNARTKSPQDLYAALTNAQHSHDFSQYLSPKEIWSLVKFIREGLIDIKTVLNDDGSARGNPAKGKPLYASQCASCHGDDGNTIDFKPEKQGVQGVGWLSKDNPQETIHKIRWGHPGSNMPSTVVDGKLTVGDAGDILAYCQTFQ